MTIKIFNNDDKHWIYPVLTMGRGPQDKWMQAWFSVTDGSKVYTRRKNYRLYINPTGTGIKPKTGIALTIPLFTRLEENINPAAQPLCPDKDPTCTDTFIDWWQGGTIQLYSSDDGTPPPTLQNALANTTTQFPVKVNFNNQPPNIPSCIPLQSAVSGAPTPNPCQLGTVQSQTTIYSDTTDLPKSDGSQLLEYTLGALGTPKAPILFSLDTRNVDFDVSYVNVAFLPATMGVFRNDQVGFTGSSKTIQLFKDALTQFKNDFFDSKTKSGWPQFVPSFPYLQNPPPREPILKFPSPLEVFSRLSAPTPPDDLTDVPNKSNWPNKPGGLWTPIAMLFENWTDYAGTVQANQDGSFSTKAGKKCPNSGSGGPNDGPPAPTAEITNFCDAITAVKWLMLRNYTDYRAIFQSKCSGEAVTIDDNRLIAHVYGWQPWIESKTAANGCPPDGNLLQDTCILNAGTCVNGDAKNYWVPGNNRPKDYSRYQFVKDAFDKLNYGTFADNPSAYVFNPWVRLVHGDQSTTPPKYINTPCAYAYSVDDALGNVQADGEGFIVAVGSPLNLELQDQCSTPILVTFGGADPVNKTAFTRYALCKPTRDRIRRVNPQYSTIVLNSSDPASCPIYVWDDKDETQCTPSQGECKPQQYTFTVNVPKDGFDVCKNPATRSQCPFPYFDFGADPLTEKWYQTPPPPLPPGVAGSTSAPIGCTGNPAEIRCTDQGCYYPSSQDFCCQTQNVQTGAGRGIFAYSFPSTDSHKSLQLQVVTSPPETCTAYGPAPNFQPPCALIRQACSAGRPIGIVAQPPARGLLTGKPIGPMAQPPGRGVLSRP
jgi:hypothetical protein